MAARPPINRLKSYTPQAIVHAPPGERKHILRRFWFPAVILLALAAGGAESPMETRLRLRLVQAGLPAPALQHRVYDERGGFLARLDLAYVAERLGVEYDGECHFDARSVRKDLRRQNALRAAGWSLLRFTSEDVFRHPQRLVAQVRAALAGKPGR